MSLLPEIIDGKLILSQEETKIITNRTVSPELKAKLKERLERIKAKKLEQDLKKADEVAGEFNNLGHAEVTEDFSDSPHADREEEESEEHEEE